MHVSNSLVPALIWPRNRAHADITEAVINQSPRKTNHLFENASSNQRKSPRWSNIIPCSIQSWFFSLKTEDLWPCIYQYVGLLALRNLWFAWPAWINWLPLFICGIVIDVMQIVSWRKYLNLKAILISHASSNWKGLMAACASSWVLWMRVDGIVRTLMCFHAVLTPEEWKRRTSLSATHVGSDGYGNGNGDRKRPNGA